LSKKAAPVKMPVGITPEEFFKLSEKRIVQRGKPTSDLMRFLAQPRTTKDIANFLGITVSATYSRLRRLQKAGYVQVGYKDKTAYWLKTPKEIEE